MSSFTRLVKDLQTKGAGSKSRTHTQTVSLDDTTHNKLIELATSLSISKTGLASRLLTAAIEDMLTVNRTPKEVVQAQAGSVVSDPLSAPLSQNQQAGRGGKRRR
jgi:hypothetical protein